MMDLRGAVAVVSGGGSGIGAATCELLAKEGAIPVAWDLQGGDIECDTASAASVDSAIAQTLETYGVPTLHVAAAGVGRLGSIIDLDLEDWDLTYAVNVRGVFLTLRAVARAMIEADLPGSIALIGSVNGLIADSHHSMYSSSKAAVLHLARCAAVELGPNGIRVNGIAVGPTETPMMNAALTDDYLAEINESTPLGRIGQPIDIAEGIINIFKSDWLTGQAIALDGGTSLVTARESKHRRQARGSKEV